MSTLAFDGARLSWNGRQVGPLDAAYGGDTILLLGDFTWLFALLAGLTELRAGSVLCLGEPAREATIAGRVGVSPVAIQEVPRFAVREWLCLNLELLGHSPRRAKQGADQTLAELALVPLSDRRVSDLNGAESFAAHAAFAASNSPPLLMLGAPLLHPETRDYELALIRRLQARSKLCLVCKRRDPELWQLADEYAYSGQLGRYRAPAELLGATRSHYRVRAFGAADRLIGALEARGVTTTPEAGDRLRLGLPVGGSSELIVEAAVESGVSLAELVSVPEAR